MVALVARAFCARPAEMMICVIAAMQLVAHPATSTAANGTIVTSWLVTKAFSAWVRSEAAAIRVIA
jgi:hypothetical protein